MKLSSIALTGALAGAIALSAAGASLAQPAPGAEPHRGMHRPDPEQMAQKHAERLRAVLQLRPDQEPALRSFLDSLRPSAEQMQRRREARAEARNLTTPQRLDQMQARMAERQAQFAKRADATRQFYAQLSPAQQRAFDALPKGRGGRGRGHGGDRERPSFG